MITFARLVRLLATSLFAREPASDHGIASVWMKKSKRQQILLNFTYVLRASLEIMNVLFASRATTSSCLLATWNPVESDITLNASKLMNSLNPRTFGEQSILKVTIGYKPVLDTIVTRVV